MQTYFCPRGCNIFDTNDTAPECGACGSVMTTDPETFDDTHEEREIEGINRQERLIQLQIMEMSRCPSVFIDTASECRTDIKHAMIKGLLVGFAVGVLLMWVCR
jgi:hypothetical protein